MKVLVGMPSRGGSKGIPRKDLRTLAGKPLIYYSIKTALASSFAPNVYVSSDDKILAIPKQTIIAAVDDTHLTCKRENGQYLPNHKDVNCEVVSYDKNTQVTQQINLEFIVKNTIQSI